MSAQEPSTTPPGLTPLPSIDELPVAANGFDRARTQDAFDAFRRHITQLQVQLRVLQAAGRAGSVEPSGHALRMDALHLIRAAAEFADTIELDATNAATTQMRKTEEDVRGRQRELQEHEGEVERYRAESERQRAEMLNSARNEARQLLTQAQRDSAQELREAEARGNRLLEQSRHQATELTNSARAEVEQTLEWARAQGGLILSRAQQGAEQLLTAAGLGQAALSEVVDAILRSAAAAGEAARPASMPPRPGAVPNHTPEFGGPAFAEPERPIDVAPEPEPYDIAPERAPEPPDDDRTEP
jgi:F0F1-type ATP synthase membrane subunit b/b'